MDRRDGVTLLELLVAIAILAVAVALLLPAIQKVREAASLSRSVNNIRQMGLAVHQVADISGGYIGGMVAPNPGTVKDNLRLNYSRLPYPMPPHWYVIRLIDGQSVLRPESETTGLRAYLISPGDPTNPADAPRAMNSRGEQVYVYGGPTSYAWNMVAFTGPPRFPADPLDGTSNTIMFSERYFECFQQETGHAVTRDDMAPRSRIWHGNINPAFGTTGGQLDNLGDRRPTFADAGWGDVIPVTSGTPPVTRPSVPGLTFQLRPKPRDADMRLPQTPFSGGLPVSFFDGSARVIRPEVAPEVFWAGVTPAGGEVSGEF